MRTPRLFLSFLGLALLLLLVGSSRSIQTPDSQNEPLHASLQGQVIDKTTRRPIVGARIRAPELGIETSTDAQGAFAWQKIPVPAAVIPITVSISSPGYGEWTIRSARLVADNALILTPELTQARTQVVYRAASTVRTAASFSPQEAQGFRNFLDEAPEDLTLPETIRVRMTGDLRCNTASTYTLATVNFNDYVKHVLPAEWAPLARGYPEVLRAGAVAVKMYAWYWIERGGKWRDADVYDSVCDQVYNPYVAYETTNQAVDYTWGWVLTRHGSLFQTHHLQSCRPPICMGQRESLDKAMEGLTWDEILSYFYPDSALWARYAPPSGFNLHFTGKVGDPAGVNSVQIPVANPASLEVRPSVNVGSQDFTIEWWLKASERENTAGAMVCGDNQNWTYGNILLDRSRQSPGGQYGVSLMGGKIAFGVTGDGLESTTVCGATVVADNRWHHIAVERRQESGALWIFVDGQLDGYAHGPQGNISSTDVVTPELGSDLYLSIGAWKRDSSSAVHPSFRGWIEELRFSDILRYSSRLPFELPQEPFTPDQNTLALYHFDEGKGSQIFDSATIPGLTPSNGLRIFGGWERGPEWAPSSLFAPTSAVIYLPVVKTK